MIKLLLAVAAIYCIKSWLPLEFFASPFLSTCIAQPQPIYASTKTYLATLSKPSIRRRFPASCVPSKLPLGTRLMPRALGCPTITMYLTWSGRSLAALSPFLRLFRFGAQYRLSAVRDPWRRLFDRITMLRQFTRFALTARYVPGCCGWQRRLSTMRTTLP